MYIRYFSWLSHRSLSRSLLNIKVPHSVRHLTSFNNCTLNCQVRNTNKDHLCNQWQLEYSAWRCMAGHAKWQNVKHTKLAKDLEKSKLCDKFSRLARLSVREGGPDPKINSGLKKIIDEAQKRSVPFSVIEGALKKASSGKIKSGFIEIIGPGGCFIIVEYECENISFMRHEIKVILKKHDANIMQGEGRWRAVFERKGIVKVTDQKDGQPLSAEAALDSAILAGAEDVKLQTDEEEKSTFLEFICDPDDIHNVKKEIMTMQYTVEEAYVAFLPMSRMDLSPQDATTSDNLFEELYNVTDIVRIYENIQ